MSVENDAPTAHGETRAAGRKPRWTRYWPLVAVALALVLFYLSGLHKVITLDTIIREREALAAAVSENLALALIAYVALYIVAVAVSFPGASLLTILGGFLFGVVTGTVLTTVGATIGASVIFLAAKTSVGAVLRARAGPFAKRFAEGFEENAFNYLLSLRLVPLFPFWLVNVVPAMFRVSLGTYVAATALGIIPGVIAYTLLGSGLSGLIEAQEAANPGCAAAGTCEIDFGALITPQIVLAMVALSAAALVPVLAKRLRRQRSEVAS